MAWRRSERREEQLIAVERLRVRRRMVREDVTVFGEQLGDLPVTVPAELDEDGRADYRAALEAYDEAKLAFEDADDEAELLLVDAILGDGRFAAARVLARRDGQPLPERRGPCFFNPQHGPAVADVLWTPPGGVAREVPVCASDRRRLADGYLPQVRMVMVGGRLVPWWAAGDTHAPLLRRNHGTTQQQRYLYFQAEVENIRDAVGGLGI